MECSGSCPYLNGRSILEFIREREALKERVSQMEALMSLAEAKIRELTEENKRLKEENSNLLHRIKRIQRKTFKPNIKRNENGEVSRRGAPKGHPGKGRRRPEEIHDKRDIYPQRCPCGSSEIEEYKRSFDEHVVEDIEVRKKVTLFRMHYGRCKRCGRVVLAKPDDSIILNSRIGPLARSVGSYLHYLGIPYRKVKKIFKEVFNLDIAHTSLMHFDTKQVENGSLIFEGIKEIVRSSPYVNIDETGWRVDGENFWLWVFVTDDAALYVIDKSRGSKVLKKVLDDGFEGVLCIDFYSAYNPINARKQRCLLHLLREIKNIEEKNFSLNSVDKRFINELKEVLKESIALWNEFKKGIIGIEELKEEKGRIISRMVEIIQTPVKSHDTKRLLERIIRHNDELFVFLDNPKVEPTNNRAERQLRPNVVMRKITFGNRSPHGARKHEIIMSIIETGKLNGIEPLPLLYRLTLGNTSSINESIKIRGP